jgi:thymidylate synthase
LRIYQSLDEAIEETRREVKEMGHKVNRHQYQSIFEENSTLELHSYGFRVAFNNNPERVKNKFCDWAYCQQQVEERFLGTFESSRNPGKSSLMREKIWGAFMDKNGKFSYTYAERLLPHWNRVVQLLREDSRTRQCVLPVFIPGDLYRAHQVRVPCSLLYQFATDVSNNLEMTYVMRSTDVVTHFANDITMAAMMLQLVAREVDVPFDFLTFFTCNMHEYETNLAGVF